MPEPIHTLVVHPGPHLDEGAAYWAGTRFGEPYFPGICTARAVPYNRAEHLDGRSEQDWRREGYLFLGCRGGEIDDHPHSQYPDRCTFTLTLEKIGMRDDPCLQELHQRVLYEDRNAGAHMLHLALLIKQRNSLGLPLQEALDRIVEDCDAIYYDQLSFHQALLKVTRAPRSDIENQHTNQAFRLVAIQSDNPAAARAARYKQDLQADLVVQKNTSGHIYVSVNQKRIWDLVDLVVRLRQAEQRKRGVTLVENEDLLAVDGQAYEGDPWFHQAGVAIFNGSLTAPDVAPTQLSLKEIVGCAKEFLHTFRPLRPRR